MFALRVIDYATRITMAFLSAICLVGGSFGLFFAVAMSTAGAGTSEPHPGLTDVLFIGGTILYLVFCLLSVFPFVRGRKLWVGGIVAHLLLLPWIPLYLRHGDSNRWMSYVVIFPIVWWFMCAVRLWTQHLRFQHESKTV